MDLSFIGFPFADEVDRYAIPTIYDSNYRDDNTKEDATCIGTELEHHDPQ